MHREYLGENYHDEIRKILHADDTLLPNRIIDADINIGGMKQLIASTFEMVPHINSKEQFDLLSKAARYYLAGIICLALKSRTSVKPFNVPKNNKDWIKKNKKCMEKGNKMVLQLQNFRT